MIVKRRGLGLSVGISLTLFFVFVGILESLLLILAFTRHVVSLCMGKVCICIYVLDHAMGRCVLLGLMGY